MLFLLDTKRGGCVVATYFGCSFRYTFILRQYDSSIYYLRCGKVRASLFNDPNAYAYGAAFWELVQSYTIITIEYLGSDEVKASCDKFPNLFPIVRCSE